MLVGTFATFSTVAAAQAASVEDAALRGDYEASRELVDQLEVMCTELENTRSLTIEQVVTTIRGAFEARPS